MEYLLLIDKTRLLELDSALIEYLLKTYDIKPFLDSVDEEQTRFKLESLRAEKIPEILERIFIKKELIYFFDSTYIENSKILLDLLIRHPLTTVYLLGKEGDFNENKNRLYS